MKHEVWLNASHPKTLELVVFFRVFDDEDRLKAEKVAETAHESYAPIAHLLRTYQPGAIISTEVKPSAIEFRQAQADARALAAAKSKTAGA